jgi:DNA-binding Lrp family transcriptional regulator
MKLDRLDKAILAQLQKSGRLSNNELADAVGLSPSPCWRRVKQLEEQGVIKSYVALLDSKKLGIPILAYAQISLDDHHPDQIERFDRFVQSCPEVLECCSLSGQYDYLLKIVTTSMEHYEIFLKEQLLKLTGVRSVNSSFVLTQKKFTTALPLQ